MSVTEGKLYITALSSLERVEMQYFPPSLAPNRQASWTPIQVVGRNNALHQYTGGSNTLQLNLDFLAEDESREDVITKCKLIESWAMSDGYDEKPERIRITFGKIFKEHEIWLVSRVVPTYSRFNKFHDMLPEQANVLIDLVLDTDHNRTKRDVQWS